MFSLTNGKVVVIFALLCAFFHIIGTEKAFAHFMFWIRKNRELNDFMVTYIEGRVPNSTIVQIEYNGTFVESKAGNTAVVRRGEDIFLEYTHIIRDEEIQSLVNAQTDLSAQWAIAIKCKTNQLL